jgi:hypothetical protein
LSPQALILWLLFAALAVAAPGVVLQRLARLPVDPALVIPLGAAFCAGTYWLALASGHPWLFPVAVALALGTLKAPLGPWQWAAGPSLRGALPPFLALVALLAATQYRWNRVGPAGDFLLDPLVPFDSAFHVGLTRELVVGYPPQVPGVAGFPLGYHLGTDLVRAAALRWAGTDPWDSLTRLDVTLWVMALVLGLRGLTARLGGSPAAVALVPWTLLLTDFSFIFAANPQAHWWTDLLRGTLLLSLVYANPIAPALAILLGLLLVLARYEDEPRRGDLALAVFLAVAVPFFKVFLGAHLLLGLCAACLLAPPARRAPLALVAAACAIATAALALGQGGRTVEVALAPLDLVQVARDTLGLAPAHGAHLVAWSALWLAASVGLRASGLAEAVRRLSASPAGAVLATVALSGWPLGLLFRVSAPEVLPGQRPVNDAAYFVEQAGPVLWVFAAIAMARFARGPAGRILTAVAVVALATPATWQYAVKKATSDPDRMPAAMVRATRALERVSRPGDVVLQRPGARYPPAPVVLAGRRVPYERFTPYLTQFASRAGLERRHEEVYRFFHTDDRNEAVAIARSLGARFLALYGADRVRFDTTGLLEPVHEEPEARLYRLKLGP